MGIVVQHNPTAAILGAAAQLGGLGQFNRWAYEQQQQREQQQRQAAIQIRAQNLDRLNAISQAALQAGLSQQEMRFNAAKQVQDHRNRLQAMMLGAQLEMQQGQQKGQMQEAFDQRRMEREQALLDQRSAAAQALQLARQQEQGRLQEVADNWKRFQNPFSEFAQQQKTWQSQGMQFTPDQSAELRDVQTKIRRVKADYDSGRLTRVDAMNAFKPLYGRMMRLEPAAATPDMRKSLSEKIVMDFPGMEGTPITINKDGEPEIVRNWSPAKAAPPAKPVNKPMETAKAHGAWYKAAADRAKAIETYVKARTPEGMIPNPGIYQEAEGMFPPLPPLEAQPPESPAPTEGAPPMAGGAPAAAPAAAAGGAPMPGAAPTPAAAPPAAPPVDFATTSQALSQFGVPEQDHPKLYGIIARNPAHAQQVVLMYGMVKAYGPDLRHWPVKDLRQAEAIWREAPEIMEFFK